MDQKRNQNAAPGEQVLPPAVGQIYQLRRPGSGDVLKGLIDIGGCPHHVILVRLEKDASGYQAPAFDPDGWCNDIWSLVVGSAKTIQVPGYPGDWACLIFPFAG